MEADGRKAEPEQLDREAFAAFAQRAGDGPVVMLNLLSFEPDGGAERYAEYAQAVAPLLDRVGGRMIFAGQGSAALIGEPWDAVALVEYPTRQAFLDMIGSPEYAQIAHLRTEALRRSALQALDAADVAGFPSA